MCFDSRVKWCSYDITLYEFMKYLYYFCFNSRNEKHNGPYGYQGNSMATDMHTFEGKIQKCLAL